MRPGLRIFSCTEQSLDAVVCATLLATARFTGQTIGAILAAISFRIAGHPETSALGAAAALAEDCRDSERQPPLPSGRRQSSQASHGS